MNKKSVGLLVLSAIVTSLVASGANANMFNFTGSNDKTEMLKLLQKSQSGETLTQDEKDLLNKIKDNFGGVGLENHFKKGKNGNMKGLTAEEKTALESMTAEQKKEFYAKKRTERQAEMEAKKVEREAHEAIIDKLLNGEELTPDEKVILEQIKTKRLERKALSIANEAKMEEMKTIMTKKMNGETLTDEETAKLKELSVMKKRGMKGCEKFEN